MSQLRAVTVTRRHTGRYYVGLSQWQAIVLTIRLRTGIITCNAPTAGRGISTVRGGRWWPINERTADK